RSEREAEAVPAAEPDAPRSPEPPRPAAPWPAPPQPAPRSRTPRRSGEAGAEEPYGQGSGSRGSGAPRRGGFDFFGTQGTRKRRRTPGTQDPAAGSSEQEEDRGRAGAPGDGGPDDGPAPGTTPPESTHPGTAVRATPPAVAGKVIDLGEPGGDESEDGGSPPAGGDGGA
ncbi:hypothetical protein ACLIYP_30790, partial [Streptomyces nanhaiensis]